MSEFEIQNFIESRFNCKIFSLFTVGNGASASVFKAEIDVPPYIIAVKVSGYPDLLKEEYKNISFISSIVKCKLPEIYAFEIINNIAYLAMEYMEGVEPNSRNLLFKKNKKKLAGEIVDNLIRLHTATNDKYGPIDNAIYDTWNEYYSDFAKGIVAFTENAEVPKVVKKAVRESYFLLDKILSENIDKATLIHGDYWCPNFIVDPDKMTLRGVLDPFNVMWAEPEYELFTLTTGYGNKLKLYDIYKRRVKTTKYCDVKLEMYALYNELLWYKKLGKISISYLVYRSIRLIKLLRKIK